MLGIKAAVDVEMVIGWDEKKLGWWSEWLWKRSRSHFNTSGLSTSYMLFLASPISISSAAGVAVLWAVHHSYARLTLLHPLPQSKHLTESQTTLPKPR